MYWISGEKRDEEYRWAEWDGGGDGGGDGIVVCGGGEEVEVEDNQFIRFRCRCSDRFYGDPPRDRRPIPDPSEPNTFQKTTATIASSKNPWIARLWR